MQKLNNRVTDTLFASGYELYDRISPRLRRFLDELTVAAEQPFYKECAKNNGFKLYSEERGSPENVGDVLEAAHPLVRTNPVTGWKSLWGVGHHIEYLHGLSDDESNNFLEWFLQLLNENHDMQLRVRFNNLNDVVIWDNRSALNAPTSDFIFENLGERKVARTVGVGERPYFDPQSTSRREALKHRAASASVAPKVTNGLSARHYDASLVDTKKKTSFVSAEHRKLYIGGDVLPKSIGVA